MEFNRLPLLQWRHNILLKRSYYHHGVGITVAILAWILYGMSFYDIVDRYMRYEDGKLGETDEHPVVNRTDAADRKRSCPPTEAERSSGKQRLSRRATVDAFNSCGANHCGHSPAPAVDINTPSQTHDGDLTILSLSCSPTEDDLNADYVTAHSGYLGKSDSDEDVVRPPNNLRMTVLDKTVMTHVPMSQSKAVNTSHQLMACSRSVSTETSGPYKKKLRRAQKLLSESLDKAKEERKTRAEMWQRILGKYHDKVLKLLRASHEKSTLMAYVRTTNQSSEKDLHGDAVALSDLKWKLQYQCQLNEKFAEDLRNKRALVNSLAQIIKPENEKVL